MTLSLLEPSSRPPQALVHFVLVLIQVLFSVWGVIGKKALNAGVNPLTFAAYREVTGSMCMYLLATRVVGVDRLFAIEKSDIPRMIFLGLCSFCNVVGFVVALYFTSAANAGAMQPSIPIYAMLLSVAIGAEKATLRKVLGGVVTVGGALLLILEEIRANPDNSADTPNVPLGNVILVGQCAAVGALIVFQRPLLQSGKYNPTQVTAYYYSIGTMLTLMCTLYFVCINGLLPWMALTYAALFATFGAYCLLTWCNCWVPASTVSLYMTLQTLSTGLLSVIFLGESVTVLEGVGALTIILGLFLVVAPYGKPDASVVGDVSSDSLVKNVQED